MQALKGIDWRYRVVRSSAHRSDGAGKSTFINLHAGYAAKDVGDGLDLGRDIDARPRDARAAIGVLPQEIAANRLSARESMEVEAA